MFEVGFSELLVIFVLALIVLGPEKLPRLAAQVGRWIGRARAMARQFREQLEEEVRVAESNSRAKAASASASPGASSPGASSDAAAPQPDTTTPEAASQPAGTPESPAATTPDAAGGYSDPHASAVPPSWNGAEPTASPDAGAGTAADPHPHAELAAEQAHHESGPPAEPEAPVYEPPAYAASSGMTSPAGVESQSTHSTASTEREARPGDVITTTHERGI